MGLEVLVGGEVGLVAGQLLAYVGGAEAGADLVPVVGIGDVVAEPGGEAGEAVLVVGAAGDRVGAVGAGDDEGEDEEDEEEDDEDGHAEEVGGEEALAVPVGTHEAGEGDEEDEDPQDNDRPPRQPDALVVLLGRQPDPRSDDRHRAKQPREVEHRRYVVAHPHLCYPSQEWFGVLSMEKNRISDALWH